MNAVKKKVDVFARNISLAHKASHAENIYFSQLN